MYSTITLELDATKPIIPQIRRNAKKEGIRMSELLTSPAWKQLELLQWKIVENDLKKKEAKVLLLK